MSTLRRLLALFLFALLAVLVTVQSPPPRADSPTPTAALPGGVELIRNGGFEIDADGDNLPDSWYLKRGSPEDQVTCNIYVGCILYLHGDGRLKRLHQDYPLPGKAGGTLTISAETKATGWTGGKAMLQLQVFYIDGRVDRVLIDLHRGVDPQRRQATIPVLRDFFKLKTTILMKELSGELQLDNVSLIRQP